VTGFEDPGLDRELLRRLASGNSDALGELYDRHAGALFRHALALSGRRHVAEDLVHAVFVKLASTGAELLGVRAPKAYLHRMVRARWIDGQRRLAAGARLGGEAAPGWAGWISSVGFARPAECNWRSCCLASFSPADSLHFCSSI